MRLGLSATGHRLRALNRSRLVGSWRLVTYIARADDGSRIHPFGERPDGSLVYTEHGWMSAQVCAQDRANLTTADLWHASEAERAAAFSSYLAYCGTYEVRSDVVVHRVVMSSFPNWVGSEQERFFEITDDDLLLRGPPIELGGKSFVHEFRWRRARA